MPFGERMTAAIREVDAEHFVFSEPWVLFNFGQTTTSLSGIGAPASGLSFHVYALTPARDEAAVDNAIASDTGDGWQAEVTGGRVLSDPCARVLAIANDGDVAQVSVRVVPASGCAR